MGIMKQRIFTSGSNDLHVPRSPSLISQDFAQKQGVVPAIENQEWLLRANSDRTVITVVSMPPGTRERLLRATRARDSSMEQLAGVTSTLSAQRAEALRTCRESQTTHEHRVGQANRKSREQGHQIQQQWIDDSRARREPEVEQQQAERVRCAAEAAQRRADLERRPLKKEQTRLALQVEKEQLYRRIRKRHAEAQQWAISRARERREQAIARLEAARSKGGQDPVTTRERIERIGAEVPQRQLQEDEWRTTAAADGQLQHQRLQHRQYEVGQQIFAQAAACQDLENATPRAERQNNKEQANRMREEALPVREEIQRRCQEAEDRRVAREVERAEEQRWLEQQERELHQTRRKEAEARRELEAAEEGAERARQFEQAAEEERVRQERLRDCVVCMEAGDMSDMAQLRCKHWYCPDDLLSRYPLSSFYNSR